MRTNEAPVVPAEVGIKRDPADEEADREIQQMRRPTERSSR